MDNKGRIFLCKCLILIAYIPQLLYAGGAEQKPFMGSGNA